MKKENVKLIYSSPTNESGYAYHYKVDNDFYSIIVNKEERVNYNCKHLNDIKDFKTYLNELYPLFDIQEPTDENIKNFDKFYTHIKNDILDDEFVDLNKYGKDRYVSKEYICKRCGSRHIADVVYGYPKISDEVTKKVKRGEIVFFGCVIPQHPVSYCCNDCGYEKYFDGDSSTYFRIIEEVLKPLFLCGRVNHGVYCS